MLCMCVDIIILNLQCFCYRRAVIGYGIDEEDQIDQWTEDAESVRNCHSVFLVLIVVFCVVCESRGI